LSLAFPTNASHVFERNILVYRRTWLILFSGFFEPLLYLGGIGFALGALVGNVQEPGGASVAYGAFVAPALMASAAMNGAIFDSTFNLFFKLKYARVYDSMLATPVGPADVAVGEIAWALFRGTLYAVAFVIVMAVLGLTRSWSAVLAVPACMLIAFCFAALGAGVTTYMRSWKDFDLMQLVLLPLFLFSGSFFPITAYPRPLQLVVEATPLYHGVDLVRGLTTGHLHPGMAGDVLYFVVLGALGIILTSSRIRRLLLK
jgi:lipooligosaccharide transport system permease protein